MGIEMTTTTDHAEIRNSLDDDVPSDPARVNTYLNAISDLGPDHWVKLSTRFAIAHTVMAIADAEHVALTAEVKRLTYDRNHPYGDVAVCPDSCGGQPWTWADTTCGGRWRCDTCNRIINRHISDALQAADDRRSL